jgi:hypothetical protein
VVGFSTIFSDFVESVRGSKLFATTEVIPIENVVRVKIMFFTNESIVM